MPTVPVSGDTQRLLRLLVILTGFFAFVLIIACLSWGRTLLIPVALALFLTFLLAPVVTFLQRTGLNRTVAIILVVLCAGISCAGVGWVVVAQVSGLAHDLRHNRLYKQNIKQKLTDLQGISKGGLLEDIQVTVNSVLGEIDQDDAAAAPAHETSVVVREETSSLTALQAALVPFLEPLSAAALVIVLIIFMLLDYEDLRNRLIGLAGASQLTTTTKALADAGQRVSRYLLMQFFINGSYGLAVGAGLFFLGVPYAVLWGFLAALFRYVPYVGPWIAAVFPITISVVAFTGWIQPCLVIGLFLLLELGSNMIMEPWLYGQSIGVSQVGLLVVTGFWTWLWGPIGLVLATPLTVCIIVLGRHVPQLRFFDLLLGDQPALDPPIIYYQRLLARDQEEAADLVEDYVRTHALESVYDEVFIPALLLAWQDRKQGALAGEDEAFILQATRAIVEDLNAVVSETENGDPAVSVESGEHPLAPAVIFGCPAHHEAEEVIVHMLQQLMQRSGSHVEVMSARTHSSEITTRIAQERPVLAFIATLPGGLPQTRYLCAALHKEFPALPLIVGYWGSKQTYDKVLVRLRQAGASYLVTSLLQGRARMNALIEEAAGRTQTTNFDSQAVEAR